MPLNLANVSEVNDEVAKLVRDQFDYKPWDDEQKTKGAIIRSALVQVTLTILQTVPPCADRSVALRKIREARMDCNSAISHHGKY